MFQCLRNLKAKYGLAGFGFTHKGLRTICIQLPVGKGQLGWLRQRKVALLVPDDSRLGFVIAKKKFRVRKMGHFSSGICNAI